MFDTRGCVGCDHWKSLGWHGGSGKARMACHYLLDTGHCRSLICPPGSKCTVRSVKGVLKQARAPMHKYDSAATRCRKAPVEEFKKLYQKGLFDEQIAEQTGAARSTVANWRLGLGLRSNRWLKKQAIAKRQEMERIKKLEEKEVVDPCLRCYSAAVCKANGYVCNEKARWKPKNAWRQISFDEAKAREMLFAGKSYREIGDALGAKRETIRKWAARRGIGRQRIKNRKGDVDDAQ